MSLPADRSDFASRLRQIRLEIYGEDGIPQLAEALGIPPRTWANYEEGVGIEAFTLLRFVVTTGLEPRWLLTGQGLPYLGSAEPTSKRGSTR